MSAERGLSGWRNFSHWGLLQLGTMPLPIDVQTLPLYLWELIQDAQIDPLNDLDSVLVWMRAGNLVFWWLLLWYGRLTGRLLAGPWGGRLAVALLACEPNLVNHRRSSTNSYTPMLYHYYYCPTDEWEFFSTPHNTTIGSFTKPLK